MASSLRSGAGAPQSLICLGCCRKTTEDDQRRLVCDTCAADADLFGRTALGQNGTRFWGEVDRAAVGANGCECQGRTRAPLFDDEQLPLAGVMSAGLSWGVPGTEGPAGDDAASSGGGEGGGGGRRPRSRAAPSSRASAPRADAPAAGIPEQCREEGLALPCIVKGCAGARCTTCVLGAFHAGADAEVARTCHLHRGGGSAAQRAAGGRTDGPLAALIRGARPTCGAAMCVLAHAPHFLLGMARACGYGITFADPLGLVAGPAERAGGGGSSDGAEWVESTIKALAVPHAVVLADGPSGVRSVGVVMAHAICMAYEHAMDADGVLVRSGLVSDGAGSYVACASRDERASVEQRITEVLGVYD